MDGRRNNGNKGHSTKSVGVDKRKNEYRQALEQAATVDDVKQVLQALKDKAVTKKDVQAIKLFLEYYLGKPVQTIEQDTNLTLQQAIDIKGLFTDD